MTVRAAPKAYSKGFQCDGKIPHASRAEANRIIRSLLASRHKRGARDKRGQKVVAYKCPHCSAWHVGREV